MRGGRRLRTAFAVVALCAAGLASVTCGGARAPTRRPEASPLPALRLDPLVDLVAAAGLVWLVDARPSALFADPGLGPVARAMAPDDRLDAFAGRHGGIDLRLVDQLAIASFGGDVLALLHVPFEPARVEGAFAARVVHVDGRALDRGITRLWGTAGPDHPDDPPVREQLALFGHDAVGFERGRLGPLLTATYFAEGRLKRSAPALKADPLAALADRLGPFPLRALAPGPFTGDVWGTGLGGLLSASTAVGAGVAARAAGDPGDAAGAGVAGRAGSALTLRVILGGAWGESAPAAGERLAACYHILAEDPVGRLLGMDRPLDEPTVTTDADTLQLDVALDPLAVAHGARALTAASAAEIMAF